MSDTMRDRILDAAGRLFLQYGYKRTTVEDIASAAGISKASIYLHVPGKEAVFHAMCDRQVEEILGAMERIAASDASPDQRIVALLLEGPVRVWDFCHQAPHAPEIWAEMMTEASASTASALKRAQTIIAGVIADGQRAGCYDSARDPRELARLLHLACEGFDAPYWFINERAEIETLLPAMVELFLAGLRPSVAPATASRGLK